MRTDTPRMAPLTDEELDPEQEAVIGPFRKVGADFGVSRAFVRHPVALAAFRTWATYVMLTPNPLGERGREILALRTAWLIKSGYVWSRHISYAQKAGLTDDEINALKRPIDGHGWSAADAVLIEAADALVADFFIPDDVWQRLSDHFDDKQCMDAIFVVGHFCMLGMFLNTAGVPIDRDVPLDPELDLRS
jgi:alkylhydroperoxidase family enzyme